MSERTTQLDLFVAYATNVAPKDQRDIMARSWFSLSKNKRTEPIEHRFLDKETGQEEFVEITCSEKHGMATIWDQDVLLFVISQWMEAINRGQEASRRICFTPYEFFLWKGKAHGGANYTELKEAIERLHNTRIKTTLQHGRKKRTHSFRWIAEYEQDEKKGVLRGIELVLPEWLFRSVTSRTVLTLNADYFDLKGGVERWLYLYARKSAGDRPTGWQESFKLLHEKSGVRVPLKEFNRILKKIIKENSLPDYHLEHFRTQQKEDGLQFIRRSRLALEHPGYQAETMRKPHSRGVAEVIDASPAAREEKRVPEATGRDSAPLLEPWEEVNRLFAKEKGEAAANAWLKNLTFLGLSGDVAEYQAPSAFVASYVNSRYDTALRDCWRKLGHNVSQVTVTALADRPAAGVAVA